MVKRIVLEHKLSGVPAYRRLIEDLGLPIPPPPGGQLVGNNNNHLSSMGSEAGFSSPSSYGEQGVLMNQMHHQGFGGAPLPRGGNGMSQSMSFPQFGRSASIDSFNPYSSPPSVYQGQSPLQGMSHSASVNSNLGFSPVSAHQPSQRFAPITPRSAGRDSGGYGSPYANLASLQSPQNYGMQMSPQNNFHPYAAGPPPQQQQQHQRW